MDEQNSQHLLNNAENNVNMVKNRLQQLKTLCPNQKFHPLVLMETIEVQAKLVEILFKEIVHEGKIPRQWEDTMFTPT